MTNILLRKMTWTSRSGFQKMKRSYVKHSKPLKQANIHFSGNRIYVPKSRKHRQLKSRLQNKEEINNR